LGAARHLLSAPSEANRRAAAGRVYYALLHEGRAALERWGFPMPPGEHVHRFVRLRFTQPAHPDLRQVGDALDELARLRNRADYQLAAPGPFSTDRPALNALTLAETAIDLLDQIEADPARRAAAIAAVRKAFP
jgi:hypothetical protein